MKVVKVPMGNYLDPYWAWQIPDDEQDWSEESINKRESYGQEVGILEHPLGNGEEDIYLFRLISEEGQVSNLTRVEIMFISLLRYNEDIAVISRVFGFDSPQFILSQADYVECQQYLSYLVSMLKEDASDE